MRHVPSYIIITQNAGFNRLETQHGEVKLNQQLFLRRDGVMVSLGTYSEAMNRAGDGHDVVIGINGDEYGHFGTPEIDNNLFILNHPMPPLPPQTGANLKHRKSRSRRSRSRRSRSRRSRSIMSRSK
jgi:hypothetical protein